MPFNQALFTIFAQNYAEMHTKEKTYYKRLIIKKYD